ncbi:four helix bundle protein [Clostridium sp. cel8]|jgi:four helix bundle protein|uniref:four helix bundle protein n=1 Tax=Clostridium sp. cel8 TaxID=2663123 RepID=UPI0015F61002|nr:four helix bundle protein [Clostridium sp. cel8]MBA5850040.1 four helix bundle protein [Clostridium sp. cel8]
MGLNLVEKKSFDFAVDIVDMYKRLSENNCEYIMSKQLLRSGTSVGANVKEGVRGQSKKDFLSKMNIALKEANETEYWIELLMKTGYIGKDGNNILCRCKELCKILNAIVKTTKQNL